MKKTLLSVLLLNFLFIYTVYSTTTIKGYIVDFEDQPIFDFLEVSLNNKKIVTGDSKFRFEEINAGDYILKVNSPESKNHNPMFASHEQRFSITIKDSEVEFWNYSPRIVLTTGKTWNFKGVAKDSSGQVLTDIDLKLYNQQNNKYTRGFSDLPTGNYSIIINDPFSNAYNPNYDFTLSDDHRNQINLTVGTYNENITLCSYSVWKNSALVYTTYNKNLGSIIRFNYPGSPLVYSLEKEKISPWVIKSWPVNQQTLFSIRDRIKITFSEDILFDAHIKNKVLLYNEEDKQYIDMSFTYDKDKRTIIANPRKILEKGKKYILLVSNISDLNNNLMQDDLKIEFYTETADFESFQHRYMVESIQNLPESGYEPPVKGERKVELSGGVEKEESETSKRKDEITVRNPDILLLVPLDENFYSSDIQIKYKVTDIDNYDVRFTLDDQKIPTNYIIKKEGRHVLKVELIDNKESVIDTEVVSFNIDKTLPVIGMNPEITESSYHKSYKGNIKVDDDNLNKVEILLNGSKHGNDLDLIKNGIYELEIKATDYAMNTSEAKYTIIIDDSPPMIISSVRDKDVYQTPFSSDIKVVDENLEKKEIMINNEKVQGNSIELKNEGRYNLVAIATDKAGNQTVINYRFELFSPENFKEIVMLNKYRKKFTEFFKILDSIEKNEGPFYLERVVLALISGNPKDSQGLHGFDKIRQELDRLELKEELSPIEAAQLKKIILLEKYWVYPDIASYIKMQKISIDNMLEKYSYLPEKFFEIYNIVNISQGNISNIYDLKTPINLDYFKMYFEDFVKNLERLRKEVNKQTRKLVLIDASLENLYFAQKLVFTHPTIDKKALNNKVVTQNVFKHLTLILNGINKSDLNPIATNVNNIKYKNLVQRLSAILRRHPVRSIVKQKQVIVSESYFGISVSFLASYKPFELEFWFEFDQTTSRTVLSNITNIDLVIQELEKLPPKSPENETSSGKDNSWLLRLLIVVIVLIIILLLATLIIKRKKKKVKINIAAEKTIESEENDTLIDTGEAIEDMETENPQIDKQEDEVDEESEKETEDKVEDIVQTEEKVKVSLSQKIKNLFKKVKAKGIEKAKKIKKDDDKDKIKLSPDMLYDMPVDQVKEERKEDIILLKKFIDKIEKGEDSDPNLESEIKVKDEEPGSKIDVDVYDSSENEDNSDISVDFDDNTKKNVSPSKQQEELSLNDILDDNIENKTENTTEENEKLNNIVEELEKEDVVENNEGEQNEESNPFEDAINELKTQTPQELIDKQKEEIQNEELAEELGVKDLIEDKDLEKYLNLEVINDDQEDNPEFVSKGEEKREKKGEKELKALNELLSIDDDEKK